MAMEKEFQTLLDDHSVTLKAGITLYEKLSAKSRQNPCHSFDTAKIAADSSSRMPAASTLIIRRIWAGSCLMKPMCCATLRQPCREAHRQA
ncbi:hypothetical protein [uncultured Mitsuokella sp.]|uniref:hypothetical protein n=1 Tax=uncultured Mitsuokella sp. TaxID=453120 RepID=UPI0025F6E1AF|nr:hypothetical protein [uncultured Mitsuokella sp.]